MSRAKSVAAKLAIINMAIEWLDGGLLPSAIPNRLMDELGINATQARTLAAEAIHRHRRGKLDTKELDEPG